MHIIHYSDAWYHVTGDLNSRLVFKWWSEYWSVNQMVIRILHYHGSGHFNREPFDEPTNPHDLMNTELVCYLDNHFNPRNT